MNRLHAVTALVALQGDNRFSWLFDLEDTEAGGRKKIRRTLLSELGRLRDPDVIRESALELCSRKPKTATGVAWLRRFSTGSSPISDVDGLANQICGLLDRYQNTPPDLTFEEMLEALDAAAAAVKKLAGSA